MRKHRVGNEKDGYQDIPFTAEEEAEWDAQEAAALANAPREAALAEISRLESTITPRRLREASADTAAGSAAGRTWLKEVDALIAAERAKL
jgi:hypothetical protein